MNRTLLGLLLLFGWWGLFGLGAGTLLGPLSFRTHSLPQVAGSDISSQHWPTPQTLEVNVLGTNLWFGKSDGTRLAQLHGLLSYGIALILLLLDHVMGHWLSQ